MNLSALNTGLQPTTVTNAPEVQTSGNASLRLPAGTLSGEDFAAFLRQQVRALQRSQRQDFAAAPMPAAPSGMERNTARPERDDSPTPENRNNKLKAEDRPSTRPAKEGVNTSDDQSLERQELAREVRRSSMDEPASSDVHFKEAPEAAFASNEPVASTTPALPEDTHEKSHDTTVVAQAVDLTTIPLSPTINIITSSQTTPDDQSLTDFALAMGLDPSQVQALFGSKSTPTTTNNLTTQQVLTMNSLPAVAAPQMPLENTSLMSPLPGALTTNGAVATADFQALKADAPIQTDASVGEAIKTLDVLNMQIATAQASASNLMGATVQPVSTLAVLSMMDTELRAEDIEALKNEFDAVAAADLGSSESGLNSSSHSSNTLNASTPAKAAATIANNPDMAQTFDKLSQKLTTELAARMHEKLNAGEWKMKFALKPASLGLVDVQLEMRDGKLTAQFNADTNLTQDLIQNGSQRLKEALGQLGMNNASVLVGQGHSQAQGQNPSPTPWAGQAGDNQATLEDDAVSESVVQTRPRHSNSLQFDNYA